MSYVELAIDVSILRMHERWCISASIIIIVFERVFLALSLFEFLGSMRDMIIDMQKEWVLFSRMASLLMFYRVEFSF